MEKIIFRSFKEGDYEIACNWWEWWWKGQKGIEREILPSNEPCFMIECNNTPVACGFLFIDRKAPIGYLTWIVSNPEYKEKNRKDLLELLVSNIEKHAKSLGIIFLFTVCGNKYLEKIHKKLDWWIDKSRTSYEIFKYI